MAGYSGTPLPKKLGIKPGCRLQLIDPPPDFLLTLGEIPEDVVEVLERVDVCVFFVVESSELLRRLPEVMDSINDRGGLWIAWPKKASRVPTDITEDHLRTWILPTGWVDNKVCAIDATWSGLRFVRRLSKDSTA